MLFWRYHGDHENSEKLNVCKKKKLYSMPLLHTGPTVVVYCISLSSVIDKWNYDRHTLYIPLLHKMTLIDINIYNFQLGWVSGQYPPRQYPPGQYPPGQYPPRTKSPRSNIPPDNIPLDDISSKTYVSKKNLKRFQCFKLS